jgi:hypothetical protein
MAKHYKIRELNRGFDMGYTIYRYREKSFGQSTLNTILKDFENIRKELDQLVWPKN